MCRVGVVGGLSESSSNHSKSYFKMPRGVKRSRDDNLLQNIILDGLIYSLILENVGGEKKFYEISVEKNSKWNRVITRYGKYGSRGISVFKEFDDDDDIKKYIQKVYHEKIRKGYEEEGKITKTTTTIAAPTTSSNSSNSINRSLSPAIVVSPTHESDTDSVLSGEDLKSALYDLKKAIAETKGFWICDTCTFQNVDELNSFCEVCQTKRVVPPVAPPGQWSCAHCTFLNDDSESRCTQCFIPTGPRPSAQDSAHRMDIKKEVKKEMTGSKANDQPDTWNCAACTFWNEFHERKCQMCDTANPNPPPLLADLIDSDSQFSGDEEDDDEDLDDDYSDENIKPKKKRQKKTPSTKANTSRATAAPTASARASSNGNSSGKGQSPSSIYMEYTGGNSSKFYELKLCPKSNGCNVSLRYGRIGSSGVEAIKHFPTQQEGLKFLEKTAESKRRKGYVDKRGGQGGGSDDDDNLDPPQSDYSAPISRSINVSSNSNNIMTSSITSSYSSSSASPAPPLAAQASAGTAAGGGGPIQEVFLTCKEGGSNKFYELKHYADRVRVRYGRCGTGGTVIEKNFTSSSDALNYFNKTRIEKINKGYRISVRSTDDEEPDLSGSGSGGGDGSGGAAGGSGDPCADLEAGKKVFVKGSSSMPYTLKKFNGGYSCTCPGFVIQIRIKGIQATTCKHLKEIRGEAAEMLRCNLNAGVVANPSSKQNKNSSISGLISLAHKWTPSKDPTGWIMSEKLDGMRAYWNGTKLWTRSGLPVITPDWFIAGLPKDMHLDGELFLGRGLFDDCMSIARRTDASDNWKKLKYIVFDAPQVTSSGIMGRLDRAKEVIARSGNPYVVIHPHEICQDMDHLLDTLAKIEQVGGEGVMLRHPTASHRGGRTNDLLKVKSFHDDEAIITGYEPGKGKYQGMVGSLVCMLKNGEVFKVGSGLTDTLRSYSNIPKIGTVITFQFFELTKDGVPRFPTYLRVRPDVDPSIFPRTALSATAVRMPS
jgi:DNA ligase 1